SRDANANDTANIGGLHRPPPLRKVKRTASASARSGTVCGFFLKSRAERGIHLVFDSCWVTTGWCAWHEIIRRELWLVEENMDPSLSSGFQREVANCTITFRTFGSLCVNRVLSFSEVL